MNDDIEVLSFFDIEKRGCSAGAILDKALTLSADSIESYSPVSDESEYWSLHRSANKDLFYGVLAGGELVGHFSALRISSAEADLFLNKRIEETEFSVFDGSRSRNEPYFIYISAVVVKREHRASMVGFSLTRKAVREIKKLVGDSKQFMGFVAEAYSDEGRRLCEALRMQRVNDMVFAWYSS